MAVLNGWRLTRTGALFFGGVIILGALLIGTIYLVTQQAEQARRDEAVKIAEQNLQEQSREVAQQSSEETNNQTVQGEASPPETSSTTSSSATALPQTGPELQLLFIVTILALSVSYYLTSRRAAHQP